MCSVFVVPAPIHLSYSLKSVGTQTMTSKYALCLKIMTLQWKIKLFRNVTLRSGVQFHAHSILQLRTVDNMCIKNNKCSVYHPLIIRAWFTLWYKTTNGVFLILFRYLSSRSNRSSLYCFFFSNNEVDNLPDERLLSLFKQFLTIQKGFGWNGFPPKSQNNEMHRMIWAHIISRGLVHLWTHIYIQIYIKSYND